MKTIYLIACLLSISCFCVPGQGIAQQRDTLHPVPPMTSTMNAGFDVIIKKNGDLVYGLVKEVTPDLVIYQRTDIPDGPFYSIPRVEVYAISYRNQVKDILAPIDGVANTGNLAPRPDYDYRLTRDRLFKNGVVRVGLGFLRSYSKVPDVSKYSTSGSFPIVSVAYDVAYNSDVRIGLQVALGSHNFSNQTLSLYDSTQSSVSLKENIFTVNLYGRYDILKGSRSALRPYVLAGIGINTSHVKSETKVNFIGNNDQVLLVSSGTRAASLGIMARVGADYYLNRTLRVFADAGIGASIINIGVAVNLR